MAQTSREAYSRKTPTSVTIGEGSLPSRSSLHAAKAPVGGTWRATSTSFGLQAAQHGLHYGQAIEAELEWGERVKRRLPCADQGRFVGSGTDATMLAMRCQVGGA
jgi:hypothetical protein